MFEAVSREVSDSRGEPYPADELDRLKRNIEQTSRRDENLERFLADFDFEILGNIYKDNLIKFGIDPSSLNLVQKEAIDYFTRMSAGLYDVTENSIKLSSSIVEATGRRLGVRWETALAGILIHEETHATSRTECVIEEVGQPNFYDGTIRVKTSESAVGYEKHPEGSEGDSLHWRLINEGVTEKFSRGILKQYAEQSGKIAPEELERYFAQIEQDHPYKVPVDFVNVLVSRISESSGFPQELVWMALVQGMYRGEGFDDPETEQGFKEQFGDQFLDRLKEASDAVLREMIDELEPKQEPSKLQYWLNYLKKALGQKNEN